MWYNFFKLGYCGNGNPTTETKKITMFATLDFRDKRPTGRRDEDFVRFVLHISNVDGMRIDKPGLEIPNVAAHPSILS